ncbi:MAG: hypothetical protein U1F08_12080 [Steroidobacteraceae bacterium]
MSSNVNAANQQVSTFPWELSGHTATRARRKCAISLCTCGALDSAARRRSTAALGGMLALIRKWLQNSPRVHQRQERVHDLRSCVAQIDRFLDDAVAYPLEWDDFISWKHRNPTIEQVRVNIAKTEPLFFSKTPGDHAKAVDIVVGERNRIAAIVGIAARQAPQVGYGHAT